MVFSNYWCKHIPICISSHSQYFIIKHDIHHTPKSYLKFSMYNPKFSSEMKNHGAFTAKNYFQKYIYRNLAKLDEKLCCTAIYHVILKAPWHTLFFILIPLR